MMETTTDTTGKRTIETQTSPIHFIPTDQVGTAKTLTIDVEGLEAELRQHVRGEVRFDAGSRAMYSQDASNYRMVPLGVVLPRNDNDVVAAVAACRRFGAPLHGRGGGTGIPGQTVNDGLLLDFSKYMRHIVGIDPDKKLATVQPGVVLDELRDAAKEHGLTFGPDPATHSRCTLGGMIGNNSCGIHSVMAGRTADNVESLDIVLYDGTRLEVGKTSEEELERIIGEGGRRGEIYGRLKSLRDRYADLIRERFPKIPRRVSGYNLDELLPEKGFHVARALVGTESTCVLVLKATVNLVVNPPVRSLLVLGFKDVFEACDHVPVVLPFKPVGLEGLDDTFIEDMVRKGLHDPTVQKLPEGTGWLLCEFGGRSKEESDAPARALMEKLKQNPHPPSMHLFDDPEMEAHIWHLREEGLGATARVPGDPDNWEGWEDAAVPPDKGGAYLRDFKKLMDKYGYEGALYGHFGDGCMHTRLNFVFDTKEGIEHYRRFVEEAADLVVRYGGSLSGEHGDGQARGELLTRMYGKELIEAFREFKEIWDPDWKMNPGKVVGPYRNDQHLKLGTEYRPADPPTRFRFPDDKHNFAYATQRCVGAGVCRRTHGGTMCPSYMVTLEEKHSTRGRARMLFEMMEGDPVKGGWKSEEVKESLDLCLSCKGCKGDCPVQVDMATYKAEFLSHYYEGRLRPRHAFAFGLIHIWAGLAAKMPGVVNLITQTPGLRSLAKWMAGMTPERTIPAFAPYTFKSWFKGRKREHRGQPRVILWADTFNDHFHPTTAQAAVEVLEAAGFDVDVPMEDLCCGRPLYDYGMVDTARGWLRRILTTMQADIRQGTPVVVLEPSCATVFRDELISLLPGDEDAARLSKQTYLLSEFLQKKAPDYKPPRLKRKALLHGHCHHKAIMKLDDEQALLAEMEMDVETPDTGCCGMAGAFGFEEGDHYDVAMKCGERVLLPAVRQADKDTLIITDGFSCREQITQTTDRVPLHLAQIIQMALHEGEAGKPGDFPEKEYVEMPMPAAERMKTAAIVTAGALLAGGALYLGISRLKRKLAG
jgi:FAD/FMN-containing dehydrogenase/Fe-S oxidoreductase